MVDCFVEWVSRLADRLVEWVSQSAGRLGITAGQPPLGAIRQCSDVCDHIVIAEQADVSDLNDHNVAAEKAANIYKAGRQSSENMVAPVA